jgi:hypothetical protein
MNKIGLDKGILKKSDVMTKFDTFLKNSTHMSFEIHYL